MQKISNNASVLIWSIFLSLTIWMVFISISTQISKNLKENNKIKTSISIEKNKEIALQNAIINKDFETIELSQNQVLIFEKSNYLNIWLKEKEEITFKITNQTNINIKINSWSPVEYYHTDDNIKKIVSFSETISSNEGEIIIKNLWWYSNITITSENIFETEYKNYKIIEKIWNKNILKEKGKIKVF